jgi:hypothetical protein
VVPIKVRLGQSKNQGGVDKAQFNGFYFLKISLGPVLMTKGHTRIDSLTQHVGKDNNLT